MPLQTCKLELKILARDLAEAMAWAMASGF